MKIKNFFVKEANEFKQIYNDINGIFNVEKGLPEQVFNDRFSNFLCEEFDWTMSDKFWDLLKTLAIKSNDDQIFMMVLDPNPVDYYHKEFNYYSCLKFPISIVNTEYFETLEIGPDESPADAILYNSFTIVWTSPSMKWGIWGQREYGVSIIAINNELDYKEFLPFLNLWKTADEAMNGWMYLEFKDQINPQKFKELFIKNYSNSV
jgi:hypothetical protein